MLMTRIGFPSALITALRDLVNTKIPFIMFSYSNILAGEIAYEDICIESKQHIT